MSEARNDASTTATETPATVQGVKACLVTTLQLGSQVDGFTRETRLLGALPELDSMAVVNLIMALEEYFGFEVDDDEIGADQFENLGALCDFVDSKTSNA